MLAYAPGRIEPGTRVHLRDKSWHIDEIGIADAARAAGVEVPTLCAPPGYEPGMHHLDPFADDEVLFTITAANMDQYADKLTEGQKAFSAE